jgi:hypothetical protein
MAILRRMADAVEHSGRLVLLGGFTLSAINPWRAAEFTPIHLSGRAQL